MSSHEWPRRVAVLSEDRGFALELSRVFADGFRSHGCEVDTPSRSARWRRQYDLVLGHGPHTLEGSLLPAARQLASYPKDRRPFFYWWFTESTCRPAIPTRLVRLASKLHAKGNLHIAQSAGAGQRLWAEWLSRLFLRRHFRLRAIGEVYEFHSRGLLGGLAVTGAGRAAYFRRHGFEPAVVPVGYHPVIHGRDLGLKRDIDVAFLGRWGPKRRLHLLERVREDLEDRGIKIVVQTHGADSEERTRFLNRTKIILNILQHPHDSVGLRLLLCGANKALVVSEPAADHEPFVPGRHMIAAPIERLAEAIEFYLSHDEQRREIADEAYRLVSEEITIHHMTDRVLNHSRQLFRGQRDP